ncbi:MAG TPA: ABC transporter permease [Pyrinomonadaceae bacterium]|jgi:peptide/nickel transport system permease protein|nr:ABC transporter permease [Pyrinomonadaceae bacterium]
MLKLILGRLLQGLVVLLVVSALTFTLLASAGGDALTALESDPLVSAQSMSELRRAYGLDQPLHVRYLRWAGDVARGRMGQSFFYRAPVESIIRSRLANTLTLSALALVFAWACALSLGALSARRAGSWADHLCSAVILLSASTPRIVLALAALAFAVRTSLFTVGPATAAGASTSLSPARVLLPAVVLCVPLIALFLAQVRDGLGAALGEDFVQVARAKGLAERAVIFRHALRAALNPLITIFGYSLGGVVSGSVIVETVLGWPGLGQLSVVAVRNRDVPLLMGVVLVTATAVLIGNLIADILLRLNDPRLRDTDEAATVKAAGAASSAAPAP